MVLPVQLEPMFAQGLLANPLPNLYVLGTVHIGSRSADEAQTLIEAVKPSCVIIEIPPSRLERIRKKVAARKKKDLEEFVNTRSSLSFGEETKEEKKLKEKTSFVNAILMLPVFASEGYTKGGVSGLLFSTIIVWSSLVKRSLTTNEEVVSLPRKNEFESAVTTADNIGADIICADLEFEDLIDSVGKSMSSPLTWMKLGFNVFCESIGIRSSDPIRRRRGESIEDWEIRRRDIETARASRIHGEQTNPELSKVLVQCRDAKFARLCMERLEDNIQMNETTVCIVGLVHLDGVVDICTKGNNLS